MEYFMRVFFHSILGVALLVVLIGCGSTTKDQKKPALVVPERSAEVIFKNMTIVQVKINLMSACSQSRMRILPDQTEVLCIRNNLDETREEMLLSLIDDDFARNMTDNVKFVITPQDGDVQVVANAYLQFISPLGVEGSAGNKTTRINLLDDASFSMAQALLKQAGAQ
jgi:hypothetical protein